MMIKFGKKPREKKKVKAVDPLEGLKPGDILNRYGEFTGNTYYLLVLEVSNDIVRLSNSKLVPSELTNKCDAGEWKTKATLIECGWNFYKRAGVVTIGTGQYDEEKVKDLIKGLKPIA